MNIEISASYGQRIMLALELLQSIEKLEKWRLEEMWDRWWSTESGHGKMRGFAQANFCSNTHEVEHGNAVDAIIQLAKEMEELSSTETEVE